MEGKSPISPGTTVEELHSKLSAAYCGSVGFEFGHIESGEQIQWLQDQIESRQEFSLDVKERRLVLERLAWAYKFENFLTLKWAVLKRFGLEGTDSMIPGIRSLIDTAADLGVENVVIGMPHRGRLNVLANVLQKPIPHIFGELDGRQVYPRFGSGDVKYHAGYSVDQRTPAGKEVHISLVSNPSHLEAANSVVLGKTKAKQDYSRDSSLSRSMAFVIHGDASFYGEGMSYETLMLSDFKSFCTGGVVHMICNNQIGYTTDPLYTCKSKYCTNVAKSFGAPIFHVNGEDVEAVVAVCKMAAQFRQKFKQDVVIDLVGFRRYGHNEGDEPRFTQPLMYSCIDKKANQLDIYAKKLVDEKVIEEKEIKELKKDIDEKMNVFFEESKTFKVQTLDWLDQNWKGLHSVEKVSPEALTGVDEKALLQVAEAVVNVPSDLILHPKIRAVMEKRKEAIKSREKIDWGLSEALAMGSLLKEGYHVRLTGQDVERGTFSHRHAIVVDQTPVHPQKTYFPLKSLEGKTATVNILNSPLSEFSVLGYEYGYSLESPKALVVWEAQFGDFANEAQVMFDQFISSSEQKWLRQSGLVVLLPHGYEGGGPEHSSARVERFLQMCDDNPNIAPTTELERMSRLQSCNWQVVNCSTPANYFHVLRRQLHRGFRKPLVLFSPKSLLKLHECTSSLNEFVGDTKFQWVLDERDPAVLANGKKIRRVILCTGKVYYDLIAERTNLKLKDIAIVTIEQISPFPYDELRDLLVKKYPKAEIRWVQEEPMNMGAYYYIIPRLQTTLRGTVREGEHLSYAGRPASAATATGFGMQEHKKEIALFLKKALD